MYEDECSFETGDISGNTAKLKKFAADVNSALDDYFTIAIQASGKWQVDDSNHTAYAEIYTDLVDGQTDYSFTADEQGNLLLDIYAVFVRSIANGPYAKIYPVDMQGDQGVESFTDGQGTEGVSNRYDKTGTAIFLEYAPSDTIEDGLKLLVNREGSYFAYDATTKKPGVPGIHHSYFFLKPALKYARIHSLNNYNKLDEAITKLEKQIKEYFGKRSKDEKPVLRGRSVPHE